MKIIVLGLAGSLSGSILTETVFNWRGMGRLYYDAVTGTPDEGVIVALTFIFTLIYVVARFILDILYVLLDPRVRYSSRIDSIPIRCPLMRMSFGSRKSK